MGVADRDPGEGVGLARDLDRDVHAGVGSVGDRDHRRVEARPAHVDGDLAHAVVDPVDLGLDVSPQGLDGEPVLRRVSVVDEVLGEDPEPVAALLGLAAVGVVDLQPEVAPVRRDVEEHAVGADPEVPVADEADDGLEVAPGQVVPLDDDVVVAETVALDEAHRADPPLARIPGGGEPRPYRFP